MGVSLWGEEGTGVVEAVGVGVGFMGERDGVEVSLKAGAVGAAGGGGGGFRNGRELVWWLSYTSYLDPLNGLSPLHTPPPQVQRHGPRLRTDGIGQGMYLCVFLCVVYIFI